MTNQTKRWIDAPPEGELGTRATELVRRAVEAEPSVDEPALIRARLTRPARRSTRAFVYSTLAALGIAGVAAATLSPRAPAVTPEPEPKPVRKTVIVEPAPSREGITAERSPFEPPFYEEITTSTMSISEGELDVIDAAAAALFKGDAQSARRMLEDLGSSDPRAQVLLSRSLVARGLRGEAIETVRTVCEPELSGKNELELMKKSLEAVLDRCESRISGSTGEAKTHRAAGPHEQ
ncbi:MAG: hypothetical protein HY791_35360 [Deltaproteobacteria bacterium]|nr:hypothetical protein [Deltaproteobacteria bacterium]